MRRAWIGGMGAVVAGVAVAGVAMPGQAQGGLAVLQAPLTYRAFTDTRELLDLTWGGTSYPLEPLGQRFPGYSVAGKAGVIRVFRAHFPGESRPLVGLVLRAPITDPTAVPTRRLWVD